MEELITRCHGPSVPTLLLRALPSLNPQVFCRELLPKALLETSTGGGEPVGLPSNPGCGHRPRASHEASPCPGVPRGLVGSLLTPAAASQKHRHLEEGSQP